MSNLKPFNLERALSGDPVVKVVHNVSKPTLDIIKVLSFPDNTYRNQLLIFYLVNKNVSCEWMALEEGDKYLFMAPKKVKYYFASYDYDGGRRGTTMMYPDKSFLLSGLESGVIGLHGEQYIIHEIEIED